MRQSGTDEQGRDCRLVTAMSKAEQREYITWRAPELARSGHYRNWREIELQLMLEGAPEAHFELSSLDRRRWLDKLCTEARSAHH